MRRSRIIDRLRRINTVAEIRSVDDPGLSLTDLLAGTGVDPTESDEAARAWLNFSAYEDHDHHGDDAHRHHVHGADEPHHHHRDDIVSFAFVREEPTSRYALQLLLDALEKNLGPNLLRVKGLVQLRKSPIGRR